MFKMFIFNLLSLKGGALVGLRDECGNQLYFISSFLSYPILSYPILSYFLSISPMLVRNSVNGKTLSDE